MWRLPPTHPPCVSLEETDKDKNRHRGSERQDVKGKDSVILYCRVKRKQKETMLDNRKKMEWVRNLKGDREGGKTETGDMQRVGGDV